MSATIDTEHFKQRLLEERARVQEAIDAALGRIESGTFGICQTCDQPIDPERLDALPHTTQCIECKRKEGRA